MQRAGRTRRDTAPPRQETPRGALVGDVPTIIIIDEIAQHLRQLARRAIADVRRMAEAFPVFLKNLFELAAAAPTRCDHDLATRQDAFGKETDELDGAARRTAAARLRETLSRRPSHRRPPTTAESIVKPARGRGDRGDP